MPSNCPLCGSPCGSTVEDPDVVGFHTNDDGVPCEQFGQPWEVQ